jgi:hypothetical protein
MLFKQLDTEELFAAEPAGTRHWNWFHDDAIPGRPSVEVRDGVYTRHPTSPHLQADLDGSREKSLVRRTPGPLAFQTTICGECLPNATYEPRVFSHQSASAPFVC